MTSLLRESFKLFFLFAYRKVGISWEINIVPCVQSIHTKDILNIILSLIMFYPLYLRLYGLVGNTKL